MPPTRSRNSSLLPSPHQSPSGLGKSKEPLIRWDGPPEHAARTTRLLDWCQENEAARIKFFSDSTQDARGAGRQKIVAGRSKNHYLREAVFAVFANDSDPTVRHLSQTNPQPFEEKIVRRIKALREQYNKHNARLGRTGAGMTYEELKNDPSKANIITDITTSFPWWPTLHGWWRTNSGFNTVFSVADAGQDLEGQALALFNMGSVDSSEPDSDGSGFNSPTLGGAFHVPASGDGAQTSLLGLDLDLFAASSTTTDSLSSNLLNFSMNIDDNNMSDMYADQSLAGLFENASLSSNEALFNDQPYSVSSSHEQFLGNQSFPPTPSSVNPPFAPSPSSANPPFASTSSSANPPFALTPSSSNLPNLSHHSSSLHTGGRSSVPFSFRGGAPCIVPPSHVSNKNVISLNSDDESDGLSVNPSSYFNAIGHDSDSSHLSSGPPPFNYFSPSSDELRNKQSVMSTPPTTQTETSSSSSTRDGKRRATPKQSRATSISATPLQAVNTLAIKAEDIVARGTSREPKVDRRQAYYVDKDAQRNQERWRVMFDARESQRHDMHELQMANLKLRQLELEKELELLRRGDTLPNPK